MGCTLEPTVQKKDLHPSKNTRHDRTRTIDAHRISCRLLDHIIENVVLTNQPLTNAQIAFAVMSLKKQSIFASLSDTELQVIAGLMVPA